MIAHEELLAAVRRAEPHVRRTPLLPLAGNAWLKLECLQPTGSFKVRGFFAAALAEDPVRLRDGLVTVSAGNAALAAAYVARRLGIACRVFMYDVAPAPKVEGVRALGAEAVLLPRAELLDWISQRGWERERGTFIHPFADQQVIAGHGGAGLEIHQQLPAAERVLVPVGGGGLICGVAAALRHVHPGIQIIGVQADGYPLWPRVFAEHGPVTLEPKTLADGTTAPFEGRMYERLRELVDGWLVVPEPRLRLAIAELAAGAKVVAEGAGALAYAALEQLEPGPPTVAVVSGGNIDPRLLGELLRT